MAGRTPVAVPAATKPACSRRSAPSLPLARTSQAHATRQQPLRLSRWACFFTVSRPGLAPLPTKHGFALCRPAPRRARAVCAASAAATVCSAAAAPAPSRLERIADVATMLFPVWALISGCTAFFHPASLNWMTTRQFEWGVGALMLAMGLSLTKEDFQKCAANPVPILVRSGQWRQMPGNLRCCGHKQPFPLTMLAMLRLSWGAAGLHLPVLHPPDAGRRDLQPDAPATCLCHRPHPAGLLPRLATCSTRAFAAVAHAHVSCCLCPLRSQASMNPCLPPSCRRASKQRRDVRRTRRCRAVGADDGGEHGGRRSHDAHPDVLACRRLHCCGRLGAYFPLALLSVVASRRILLSCALLACRRCSNPLFSLCCFPPCWACLPTSSSRSRWDELECQQLELNVLGLCERQRCGTAS